MRKCTKELDNLSISTNRFNLKIAVKNHMVRTYFQWERFDLKWSIICTAITISALLVSCSFLDKFEFSVTFRSYVYYSYYICIEIGCNTFTFCLALLHLDSSPKPSKNFIFSNDLNQARMHIRVLRCALHQFSTGVFHEKGY